MTANGLVEAGILATEVLEEGGYRAVLVGRAWKMVREAPAGEARRNHGVVARRAADAGSQGPGRTW